MTDIVNQLWLGLATNHHNFLEQEIPSLHPKSRVGIEYWQEQKRRCIEGHWIAGKWMPGKLYFYINFGTIKRNEELSKVKTLLRPLCRDIDWRFFLNWEEARGFSGFEQDSEFSCLREIEEYNEKKGSEDKNDQRRATSLWNYLQRKHPDAFTSEGKLKQYIPARQYLEKVHPTNLGRPLYGNQSKNYLMLGSRGFGKDVHSKSKVWTAKGPVAIEKIKVGDFIYGDDGQLTKVTNRLDFNDQMQYEVELADGRIVRCGEGHKWVVRNQVTNKVERLELSTIMKDYLQGSRQDAKYFVPITKPVLFHKQDLPLDPYTLGALIGDGGLTQRVTFTTEDPEIIEYFKLPQGAEIVKTKSSKYTYSVRGTVREGRHIINPVTKILNELGLMGKKSTEKEIPQVYLRSSSTQRMELLRGLMDTDGYISTQGNIEFSASNEKLAFQVKYLCESLGIRCSLSVRETACLDNFRLKILTSKEIFKLSRKLERLNLNPSKYAKTNREWVAIKRITPLKIHPSVCLSVDNENAMFLVEDFVPTSNSYSVGVGIVLHEWLFDGLNKYVPPKEREKISSKKKKTAAEIVVGAGHASYSTDILAKTQLALSELPGGYTDLSGEEFPSPFSKLYKGAWTPNNKKGVQAVYRKKIGGTWHFKGTGSSIKHRTFNDNPFAANGTRPGVMVFEEIGMFNNLLDSYNAAVECQRNGSIKFGSMMFLGTGGDFEGGGTRDAHEMFYNPDKYDIIAFEDYWERRGKIGYFVPAYLGLNDYKDQYGNTDIEGATHEVMQERDRLRKQGGNSKALNNEIQYRPVVPSEMFLAKTGNIFPVDELMARLALLDNDHAYHLLEKKVRLYFDEDAPYGVNYKLDPNLEVINRRHWDHPNRDGGVVIFDFPEYDREGKVPQGLYLIGHDPYASDDPDGESLAATYVIKTKEHWQAHGHDEIVAAYVGRPSAGRWVINENLMKLSLFYGEAKIYFENVRGNVKEYFEKKKSLKLLARQPVTLFNKKASHTSKFTATPYGYPMSSRQMKLDGLHYLRDWLMEERENRNGKIIRNLDLIRDRALLEELIAFDLEGNYDRVMGMIGCVVGLEETYNQYVEETHQEAKDQALSFLSNNRLVNTRLRMQEETRKQTNNIIDTWVL